MLAPGAAGLTICSTHEECNPSASAQRSELLMRRMLALAPAPSAITGTEAGRVEERQTMHAATLAFAPGPAKDYWGSAGLVRKSARAKRIKHGRNI